MYNDVFLLCCFRLLAMSLHLTLAKILLHVAFEIVEYKVKILIKYKVNLSHNAMFE